MIALIVFLAGAYLAGSVNFSILLFALLGKGDPRSRFSGNAGATNVWRQAGLAWASLVLFLDLARAIVLALAALHFLPSNSTPWVGLALVVGNRYPCFHGFRGGKGVAAYLGLTIPLAPYAAALSTLIWAGVYSLTRLPFIASFFMVAILAVGTIITFGYNVTATIGAVATVAFIIFNHRENIMNLIREKK
jgi:glycerol-3-phosphate acyltransferase PlsY